MPKQIFYIATFCILSIKTVIAADNVIQFLDTKRDEYVTMSKSIWEWAELGYQERKTSTLMQTHLEEEGFSIQTGVAEIPTAFIANYGSG